VLHPSDSLLYNSWRLKRVVFSYSTGIGL